MRAFVLAALLSAVQALGQSTALPELPSVLSRLGPAAVPGVDLAMLDPALLGAIPQTEFVMVGVPAGGGRTVSLRLERFDVLTPDAQLINVGADGPERTPRPSVVTLRGQVVGDPDSWVVLGLAEGMTNGVIETGGKSVIIASPDRGREGPIAVYDPSELPAGAMSLRDAVCGGGLQVPAEHRAEPDHAGFAPRGLPPCRVLTIAVETDFEYFSSSLGSNATNAQNYATFLMSAVSEIYRREFNTSLQVNFLRIWTTNTDPYPTGSTVNDRLNQFRTHWTGNMTGTLRNLAHMLTGRTSGAGGVAWLGVVCDWDYGYGASGYINGSFPYPLVNNHPQNWDVMVVSHEMGHNIGAPHTHDMSPQIDRCGSGDCSQASQGTIMSYCHTCAGGMTNMALTMHPRIVNERILPHLQGAAAWCSINRNPPTITAHPAGATRAPGASVNFQTTASGGQPIAWVWRRNGSPLSNNARISGATTNTLTINPVAAGDAGVYTAVATNSCGNATTNGATLTVCRSDLNNDGVVDFNDYLEFLNLYNASNPRVDFNADSIVDFNDYLEFLNLYNTGC